MKHRYNQLVNPWADGLKRPEYASYTDEREKFSVIVQNTWLRPRDQETGALIDEARQVELERLAEINKRLIEIINERIYGWLSLV